MINISNKIKIIFVAFIILILSIYFLLNSSAREDILVSVDNNYVVKSSEGLFSKTYDTVDGLYGDADIVAEIMVDSQENIANYEDLLVHTLSQVKLLKVYKGDISTQIISVMEFGGEYDERIAAEYIPKGKASSGNNAISDLGIVELGLEDSVPIKKGNKYLAFLIKHPDENYYNVVGVVQGKIKIENNKLISQVSKSAIEHGKVHNNLYFLQEKYSGKEILEITKKFK